jgi:hypothetical protein
MTNERVSEQQNSADIPTHNDGKRQFSSAELTGGPCHPPSHNEPEAQFASDLADVPTHNDIPTDNDGEPQFNSVELTSGPCHPPSNDEPEAQFASDLADLLDFRTSELTDDDTGARRVMKRMDYWAKVVSKKYERPDIGADLAQELIKALRYSGKYRGDAPLDSYVFKSAVRLAKELISPQVRQKSKRVKDKTGTRVEYGPPRCKSIDDPSNNVRYELRDNSAEKLQDKILAKIYFDESLRKLIGKSDLHEVVGHMVRARVYAFLGEEQEKDVEDDIKEMRLTDRRIASVASKKLGRDVSRNQAAAVLAEFRPAFELLRT